MKTYSQMNKREQATTRRSNAKRIFAEGDRLKAQRKSTKSVLSKFKNQPTELIIRAARVAKQRGQNQEYLNAMQVVKMRKDENKRSKALYDFAGSVPKNSPSYKYQQTQRKKYGKRLPKKTYFQK